MSFGRWAIPCAVMLLVSPAWAGGPYAILHVDADAAGAGTGATWADAIPDLQKALGIAAASGGTVKEIWVAEGVYRPTAGGNPPGSPPASFRLLNGVAVRGGFAGTETGPEQRDLSEYQTVLSGDLKGDDGPYTVESFAGCTTYHYLPLPGHCARFDFDRDGDLEADDLANFLKFNHYGENAGPVVYSDANDATAVLDGFVITHGAGGGGGGLLVESGKPTLVHCVFYGNAAAYSGGGIKNNMGGPQLTGCRFTGNVSGYEGGGISNYGGGNNTASLTLTRCSFNENAAVYDGGAIESYGVTLMLAECRFENNVAGYEGGAVGSSGGWRLPEQGVRVNPEVSLVNCLLTGNRAGYSGGGVELFRTGRSFTNCAFIGNSARNGGGLSIWEGDPLLTNCTFSGNTSSYGATGIDNAGGQPHLANCILWGNGDREIVNGNSHERIGRVTAKYSNVRGGWPGLAMLDADPRFRDPGRDVRLQAGSPCIDAGMGSAALSLPDLAGNNRFVDDPATADTGAGPPPIVDMGAYEYFPDCNANDIDDRADIAKGTSGDCDANGIPDECQPDCNRNGRADACDIAAGSSADCNANRVPDECELADGTGKDCNQNGVIDACDIAGGHSPDGNGNGIPDECEEPPCRAERKLPEGYLPEAPLTVLVEAKPGSRGVAYAVEDRPPAGWTVISVGQDGQFDAANGKVKWGPFFDRQPRVLEYVVLPPANADGDACFGPGTISVDGASTAFCGATCVSPCKPHPADADENWRLGIDEVTAYAACWRRGCTWNAPPNPIPVGFVTRAGYLWQRGETYCCDFTQPLPQRWVACAAMPPNVKAPSGPMTAAADSTVPEIGSAQRTVMAAGPAVSPYVVTIVVTPGQGISSYAVEETPPLEWAISAVSDRGVFDEETGRIRWGPFYDDEARTLTYLATPPDERSGLFTGVFSADGVDVAIGGVKHMPAAVPADFDLDGDVDQNDFGAFQVCITGPGVAQDDSDCDKADFDSDGDVDQADFGVFQRCISGAGKEADPACVD